jgi:hypothetical protein
MAGLFDLLTGGGDPWGGMRSVGQQSQGGGLLQRLLDPSFALPMAAGLMGNQGNAANIGQGFANAAPFMALAKQQRENRAQTNKTLAFLQGKDPELAAAVEAGALSPTDAYRTYMDRQRPAKSNLTDDQREYQMAKEQGFDGSFMEYLVKMKEAGRQQVNIDTGVKLPSGYRWKDPNNQDGGVEPIPGGPATQMPAELAARIGLAKDALTKLDRVEQSARSGQMTGIYDWGMGQLGRGEQGELTRELKAGAEALTRMLTGAGMNMAEVSREVQMYLPAVQDDAETLANKVSQLKRRLQSTIDMAGRGRGLDPAAPAPSSDDGWQDLGGGVRIRRMSP